MSTPQPSPDLLGQSRIFLDALEHVSQIAMIDGAVLIAGERGAGKELLANRIHFLSPRWEGPFIKLNCAAWDAASLEHELFGHGAGGSRRIPGRIERAHEGTLLLDEISAAPRALQERLLKVLEHGEFEQLGAEAPRTADVRIIAASSQDLRRLAHDGVFSPELLERIAVDVIALPPLRNRDEDTIILASHFASLATAEMGLKFPGFSPEATLALNAHDWPGNVRELKSVAERAAFHWGESDSEGRIHKIVIDPFERAFGCFAPDASLAKTGRRTTPAAPQVSTQKSYKDGIDLKAYLSELEKAIVKDALARNGDNQKRTADALCLTYDQIRGIVKKHDL